MSFTWDAPAEPLPGTITGYVGGLVPDGGALPTDPVVSGQQYPDKPDGTYDFYVAAVYDDGDPLTPPIGPYAEMQDRVVDDTNPVVDEVELFGSRTTWGFRSLTLVPRCSDNWTGIASGCGSREWELDGVYPSGTGFAPVDGAGNIGAGSSPAFSFDATAPDPGQPSNPGRLVADEPVFEWTRGTDATSGVLRYELQWKPAVGGSWQTIARVDHDPDSVRDYFARRDTDLREEPLPVRELLKWRVRTIDGAGNSELSGEAEITIDPTVPPAPTITGGPAAPTRISSPTFSWSGAEDTYLWDLTAAGSATALRRGGGPATQATITNLPDGDYTFRVSQVTEAGRPSAEATRSFKVDTTAPAPPGILVRPPFPAIAAPVFTWEAEPGAYSRWTVLGEGGVTVIPPTDTPTTTANLPLLPDGAYSFQVRQIDAAGNVSAATAEPFTMLAPLAPAPSPSLGGGGSVASALPRQNALRLKPKAGRTLPTRAPVLQWKRGPRGTKLYNLQIFRVTSRRGARTPKITKVVSRFPRGLQMRAPKRNLKPNTCYVWRVWPYTGRAFTPKPVGVSNFCVANKTVLKKKAAAARAKKLKIARARKAAAPRSALRR